ncbi:MAG: hypothetical protein JO128_06375 [Alphaproteobacteria bacterium]|nr:hypothetical protein [Alphaproteobacteria bacterium]
MRRLFASVVPRAHSWATVTLTESYLRAPHPLKKYLERRNPHAPHDHVSAVVWLSGAQAWCLDWLADELSIGAGLLFLAAGMLGAWIGRRLLPEKA